MLITLAPGGKPRPDRRARVLQRRRPLVGTPVETVPRCYDEQNVWEKIGAAADRVFQIAHPGRSTLMGHVLEGVKENNEIRLFLLLKAHEVPGQQQRKMQPKIV